MKIRIPLILMGIIFFTACRGDDQDLETFIGTWRINTTNSTNECKINRERLGGDYLVIADNSNIKMKTIFGVATGQANSVGGFTVEARDETILPVVPGIPANEVCPAVLLASWEFSDIVNDTANVKLTVTLPVSCVRKVECSEVFVGSAEKIYF